ncbi:MAG: J domain-containing protein [Terriglobales bacterium]|jgi:hypothetical protein
MSTCSCGDVTGNDGKHCDRCAALRVLDLEAGASNQAIKDAYHSMAKVWHPDRFEHDVALRKLAEDKFKRINVAYQLLTHHSFASRRAHAPRPQPAPPSTAATKPEDDFGPAWEPRPAGPPPKLAPGVSPLTIVLLFGIILVGITGAALSNTSVGQRLRSAACALGPRKCDIENTSIENFFGGAFSQIRQAAYDLLPGSDARQITEGSAGSKREPTSADHMAAIMPPAPALGKAQRPAAAADTSGGPNRLVLHDGIPVRLRIAYPVSLAKSTIGQTIDWEVAHDVMADGAIGIPSGAKATAIVASPSRLSAAPKLSMNIEQVVLASGLAIPLEANSDQSQNLDFYPRRSTDDAVIPSGTEVTVFVHGNVVIPAATNSPMPLPRDNTAAAILPDGTPVPLSLVKEVDAEESAVGDQIAFEVASDVAIDGEIVAIRRGTIAWATVTEAVAASSGSFPAQVTVKVEMIRLSDGSTARLRGVEEAGKSAAGGKMPGLRARVARWLISARHANDTVIPQGSELTAYVDGDVQFQPPALASIRR